MKVAYTPQHKNDLEHPCDCNWGHRKVFDLAEIIDKKEVFNLAEIIDKKRDRTREVQEALRFFELAGQSSYRERQEHQNECQDQSSMACTRFLLKAFEVVSRAPVIFTTKFKNYWSAYAMICIQLLAQAKKEAKIIDEGFFGGKILDTFQQQEDDEVRYNITRGLVDIIASIDNYEEWLKYQVVLEPAITGISPYWIEKISKSKQYRDSSLSKGAASLVDIWCYLCRICFRAIREGKISNEFKDSFESFCLKLTQQIVDILEILAVFSKVRGSHEQIVSSVQFFKDCLYDIKNLKDEPDIAPMYQELSLQIEKTLAKNDLGHAVRNIFDEFLYILKGVPKPAPERKNGPSDGSMLKR